MRIYMDLSASGLNASGPCTRVGHEKWFEVAGLTWAASVEPPTDGAARASSPEQVVVTKSLDLASPLLYKAVCEGGLLNKVTFEYCRPHDGQEVPVLRIELNRVAVVGSNVRLSSGEEAGGLETIQFAYSEIRWTVQSGGDRASTEHDFKLFP